MPNQPLRRSQRIAAKAAKKEEEVDDGNTATSNNKKQPNTTTSSSRRRSSRLRSRSRSRTRRCSLQSLEENTLSSRQSPRRVKSQQKANKKKTYKSSAKAKKSTAAASHVESTFDETTSTMTPAVKSNKYTSMATVTPNTAVVKSKGVKFNLGRNIIAQYIKENPPNIVEYLTDEVVAVSEELFPVDDDDETTRRNEELLAECDLDTCQVSRRAVRRVSMST